MENYCHFPHSENWIKEIRFSSLFIKHTVRIEDLLAFLLKRDFFLLKTFSTSSSTVYNVAGDSLEVDGGMPLKQQAIFNTNETLLKTLRINFTLLLGSIHKSHFELFSDTSSFDKIFILLKL